MRRPSAFLLTIGLQVGGFRLGACIPDAFWTKFGRGWSFQILRGDALNIKQPTLCTESSTPPIREDPDAKCL